VFLDVLRAVAVVLVVYSHVVGIWLHQHQEDSALAPLLQGFLPHPLDLALNVGNVGVVLFFLVSGFVVTHTGCTETPRQYAVKRLLRVYPMLVVAVLLAAVLFLVGLHPLTTGSLPRTVTPLTVLTNASLADYLLTPQVVLLDVGWTLVVEVLFYALLLVALPLLRRAVLPVIAGELGLVALVCLAGPALVAVSVSYLPALLLGQIVWATWSRRVPPWAGVALGATAWVEYVWTGVTTRPDTAYDHNANLALGLVVFVVALLAEPKLRPVRWIGYVADRGYSLYLLHGLVAFVIMNLLYRWIGYPGALVAGLAATVLAAATTYRWVERPCIRLAREIADSGAA
jgi:peptidoglycan/LPS O-acetylase OafA/YrhL